MEAQDQVPADTPTPQGWSTWNVPANCWLRVSTRMDQHREAVAFLRDWIQAQETWGQAGAVHEFHPRDFLDPATDPFHLCVALHPRESPKP